MSCALALAAPIAPGGPVEHPSSVVDANDHDSFWLWAGVKPQPVLETAQQVYILQGEVTGRAPVRLVSQRPAIPRLAKTDVWMVVRVETLDWPPEIHEQIAGQIARWHSAGTRVVGLQIDFDAATRNLEHYAVFLAELRRRLDPELKLGITGLLDWSANGDPKGLDALAGTVDEVVLQIYQGRRVIPGYAAYFDRLDRMKVPFRVGLLQGGPWQPPPNLARSANFIGYVVFLTNAEPAPGKT